MHSYDIFFSNMQRLNPQILFSVIAKLPDDSKFKFGFSNKHIFNLVDQFFFFHNLDFRSNIQLFNYLQVSPIYFSISQFRHSCLHCQQYVKLNQKIFYICESCFIHNISYFKINKQQLHAILKSDTSLFLSQYDYAIQSFISPQSKKYLIKSVLDFTTRIQNEAVIQLISDLHQQRIQEFIDSQQENFCSSLINDLNLDPLDNQRIRSLPLFTQFFKNKNYSYIHQIQFQLSFISSYQSNLIDNIHSIVSQFQGLRFSKKISYQTNQFILDQLLSLYNIQLSNKQSTYNDIFNHIQSSKIIYPFILMDVVQNLQEAQILNQIDQYSDIQHLVSQMIGLNFHYTTLNSNYQKQFFLAAQFIGSDSSVQQNYQLLMSQIVTLFFWFENSSSDITKLPPRVFILYMFYMQIQQKKIY